MCAEEGCGSREHLVLIMKAGAEFAAVGAESLAPSSEPGVVNREQTTSSRGRLGPAPPAQALPICEGAFKILGLLLSPPIQRLNCSGVALGSRKRGLKGGQWRNLPFLPQVPPPVAWGRGSDMGAQGSLTRQ